MGSIAGAHTVVAAVAVKQLLASVVTTLSKSELPVNPVMRMLRCGLYAWELEQTTINTKGYESLLSLVNNTYNDSFDLYYGGAVPVDLC